MFESILKSPLKYFYILLRVFDYVKSKAYVSEWMKNKVIQ